MSFVRCAASWRCFVALSAKQYAAFEWVLLHGSSTNPLVDALSHTDVAKAQISMEFDTAMRS